MNPVVCYLDLETTGLDFDKDQITEIGYVIKRWGEPKPYHVVSEFLTLPPDVSVSPEITELTGITDAHLTTFGEDPSDVVRRFVDRCVEAGVLYIIAHNGENFDAPFLFNYCLRTLGIIPTWLTKVKWLDSKEGIVYPKFCKSTSLLHLCAYHGFLNPFPHAAVFDAMSTAKLVEMYSLEDMIKRSKEPWVVVRALVLPPFRDEKPEGEKEVDLAKARRYRWQDCGDGNKYEKCWVKRIKASCLEREMKEAPFKVVEIKNG